LNVLNCEYVHRAVTHELHAPAGEVSHAPMLHWADVAGVQDAQAQQLCQKGRIAFVSAGVRKNFAVRSSTSRNA
jgi:hypothetical protein